MTLWRASRVRFDDVARLQEHLGCGEPLAWALVRRGLGDPAAAEEFLSAGEGPLEPPETIPGVTEAARRLADAVARGEQIVVHGDYDCDGVCSTAVMALALRARGGRVETFLPSRFRDGYGVSIENVERFAHEGADVLVCVDCGTTALEALTRARELGLEVIVIDHHLAGGRRPPAILVNPALGRGRDDLPAAAGVALSVVRALGALADRGIAAEPEDLVDLAALATVADAVPLVGENRRIVARGIVAMRAGPRPGIAALCAAAGVEPRLLGARDLGFGLGPAINAAGRLADADRALELVTSHDRDAADPIARELWNRNMERRDVERRITDEAIAVFRAEPEGVRGADALVVSGDGWHEGVVGIVASRLAERYARPAIVITRDGDTAKGSGRSVAGVDLHDLVGRADAELTRWGGHAGAVGVQLPADAIGRFRAAFLEAAVGARAQIARATIRTADVVAGPRDLTLTTAEDLARLEPFGRGNPPVRMAVTGCAVGGTATVGDGRHLRLRLSGGGAHAPAIAFRMGERARELSPDARYDAVVELGIERFQGLVGPKVVVDALAPLDEDPTAVEGACADRCDLGCPDRVRGPGSVGSAVADVPAVPPAVGPPRGVRDRRGEGAAVPVLAALAGADEGAVAVVADVAWRRAALVGPLQPHRLGVEVAILVGSRCATAAARARMATADGRPALVMIDYEGLGAHALPADVHVVAVDPPAGADQAAALRAAAADRWLHLTWGPDEVEMARAVAERGFDLRPMVAELWRALRGRPTWAWGDELEAALLGDGAAIREPRAVARALRVLEEVGLVVGGEDGLTVASDGGRRELEASATYAAATKRLEEARRMLSHADTLDLLAPPVRQAA